VLFFLLLISPYSLAQSCNSINVINKIVGAWGAHQGNQIIKESWGKVSKKTIEGSGATYFKEKVKNSESMRIVEMSGSVFYIAKVSHNSVPVAFRLIKCTDKTFVFENNKHDFPKRIEYKFIHKNKMLVNVSDGKGEGITIKFIRKDTI
jgi:hypothetical protein